MNNSDRNAGLVTYPPAEPWLLTYEDGSHEQVSLRDGVRFDLGAGAQHNAAATFSQEIDAPSAQTLQIGIGADWYWRCTLNGEVIADFFGAGNGSKPIEKSNHPLLLPLKAGRNHLEITVRSGSVGWSIATGALPAGYDALQEKLSALLAPAARPQDCLLQSLLPTDFLDRTRNGGFNRRIYPGAEDRTAWEKLKSLPEHRELIRQITERAEAILKQEIPPLPYSEYRRFAIDGDRRGYEAPYFARRRNMGTLVLALALTRDSGRYMARTLDYINAILEEWTWCVPAHMSWDRQTRSPKKDYQSDLFACETAAQLALTVNILGEMLENEWPGLCTRIRDTVLLRTVYNTFTRETSFRNDWLYAEEPANWTPWCSSNLALTAMILEPDPQKLAHFIGCYLKGVSRFVWYYPEDGFCSEGPGYYGEAAVNLYRLCDYLERFQPGSADRIYRQPKIRAMLEFLPHCSVHSWLVAFGDAMHPLGSYRSSPALKSCGQTIGCDGLLRIASLPVTLDACNGNGNTLTNALLAFFGVKTEAHDRPAVKAQEAPVSFFKDRLAVFRSEELSAALKGGNNGEAHNHNDLGHFSIWYKDQPLIIDPGRDTYTRQYFSEERYTLWNTRGRGHNAPVFDDIEQISGNYFFAPLTLAEDGSQVAVCDLSHSYPQDAGVLSFTRTLRFSPAAVTVEDQIRLRQMRKITIRLYSTAVPQVDGHRLSIGGTRLELTNLEYCCHHPVDTSPAYRSQVLPGFSLTETVLEATAPHYRMHFTAASP